MYLQKVNPYLYEKEEEYYNRHRMAILLIKTKQKIYLIKEKKKNNISVL